MHTQKPDEKREQMVGDKRALLIGLRQVLIMALGSIEDYLGMVRSIIPKHKRR